MQDPKYLLMAGKLNGQIPAVTPSGSRYDTQSIFDEIPAMESPKRLGAIQQADSTISSPRKTSPLESAMVFPFSRVIK